MRGCCDSSCDVPSLVYIVAIGATPGVTELNLPHNYASQTESRQERNAVDRDFKKIISATCLGLRQFSRITWYVFNALLPSVCPANWPNSHFVVIPCDASAAPSPHYPQRGCDWSSRARRARTAAAPHATLITTKLQCCSRRSSAASRGRPKPPLLAPRMCA